MANVQEMYYLDSVQSEIGVQVHDFWWLCEGCDITTRWINWTSCFLFNTVDQHTPKPQVKSWRCCTCSMTPTSVEAGFHWTKKPRGLSLWCTDECYVFTVWFKHRQPSYIMQPRISLLLSSVLPTTWIWKKCPQLSLFIQCWLHSLLLHLST